jgi:hypothetical protein
MSENNDSVVFEELPHSDDWPDATSREDEVVLDEAGQKFLADLERKLNEFYESDEVQNYLKEQEDN